MMEESFDFSKIVGFEWDDGNREKNWLRHAVTVAECEEIFFNQPLLVTTDDKHSQKEPRLYALGKTNAGRRLFISFTLRGSLLRVISARDMSRKERRIYDQKSA